MDEHHVEKLQNPNEDKKRKRSGGLERELLNEARLPGLRSGVSRLEPTATGRDSTDSKSRASREDSSGELISAITTDLAERLRSHSYNRTSYVDRVETNTIFEKSFVHDSTSGGNRYSLGLELTITALIAIGGIRRRRGDLSAARLSTVSPDQLIADEKSEQGKGKRPPATSDESNNRQESNASRSDAESLAQTLEKAAEIWAESCTDDSVAGSNYLYGSVMRRPSVLVTLADTLVSIAERHYHDRLLGWLIADLNRSRLTERLEGKKRIIEIQNGQMIELPVWEDVVEFYQHKPKGISADNLITLVFKRGVDRQKLQEELAKLLAPEFDEELDDSKEDDE